MGVDPYTEVGRGRMWEALGWGAMAGAFLTALTFGGAAALASPSALGAALPVVLLTMVVAAFPWLMGVFILGAPLWLVGERLGLTAPWKMALIAALTPFATVAGIQAIAEVASGSGSITRWFASLGFATYVGGIGAVVGLVAHFVAYRR